MAYKVYTTPEFDNLLSKLSKAEQERIEKLAKNLAENPYQGKPLGTSFFREKKIDDKRIYYLIYDEYVIVLLVSISDKKTQQKTINEIKINRDIYLELAHEISKKN
jgi:mRNA-degrading endonuclease RelE of RelBE toxin-antitoxin system